MPKNRRSPLTVAPTITAVAVLLLACSIAIIIGLLARPSGSLSVPKRSHVLHVEEHDFHIQLHGTTTLRAGNYVFVDRNQGPSAHELVMWKTNDADNRLPVGSDHRVNEESSALDNVLDSGSSLQAGETRLLTVSLDPGHYVLVCNLPGHFMAGMHVDITVD